jgi:hypothetical protein
MYEFTIWRVQGTHLSEVSEGVRKRNAAPDDCQPETLGAVLPRTLWELDVPRETEAEEAPQVAPLSSLAQREARIGEMV